MNKECIDEVEKAIGRTITPAEAATIVDHINNNLKAIALSKDFPSMTGNQRVVAAAQRAQESALAAAALKRQRTMQQIAVTGRLTEKLDAGVAKGATGADSLNTILHDADIYLKGVAPFYFSKIRDTIKAVEPRFFGLMEDVSIARAFVAEVMDNASGKTGDPIMQKAARAWLDSIESMRVRFNRAGGNIGKLAQGYLPQMHDASRLRMVSAETYAARVLPLVDRRRYVGPSGRPLSDSGVMNVLREAHTSITLDGADNRLPGAQEQGMRANRGSEHRIIHFKDADSYLSYIGEFGSGSVFTSMQGHINGLGRDIGLVEYFGPNPELMFRTLDDTARTLDGGVKKFGEFLTTNKQEWAVLSGESSQVQHQRLADIAQAARNIQVFGKLGRAVVSSVSDLNTYFITTRFHKLPSLTATMNLARALGGDKGMREFANRNGLVAESLTADLSRWSDSNLKGGVTSQMANGTMKLSLMNAWTNAIRRAFSVTMMGNLGKISRNNWNAIDAMDRAHMEKSGVTPDDWKIWKLAEPEKWRNSQMLTPESILAVTDARLQQAGMAIDSVQAQRLRDRAATRLLGLVTDESEYASVAPDLYTRTVVSGGGLQAGTLGGETARTMMQFKSFPIAMMSRHMQRMLKDDMSPASRVEYGAMLAVFGGILGAISLQAKDMLDGKDPRDMTTPKFWTAAMLQGGGLGFVGDIVYQLSGGGKSQSGRYSANDVVSALAGPTFGTVLEAGALGINAVTGEDFGAGALRLVKSNTPFIGLWYARAVVDHAALNHLQELLSPGYNSRVAQRIRRDWGQDMWWPRDSLVPDREPNFGNAVGN